MQFTRQQSQKVKGGATCLLIYHHLFDLPQRFEMGQVVPWVLPIEYGAKTAVTARVCVWIFAFISAYGITSVYENKPREKSISLFSFERWFPLMSGYWFAYAASIMALAVFHRETLNNYGGNVLFALFDAVGIADFFGTPTLNGAWWYIFFAQCLVILMPIFIFFCKRFGWSAFFMSILLLQYLPTGIYSGFGGAYSDYLPAVLLGILCEQYKFFHKWKRYKGLAGVFQLFALTMVFLACCSLHNVLTSAEQPFNTRALGTVFFSIAAMVFCLILFLFAGGYLEKILIFIGKHSGNIFYIHNFYIAFLSEVVYYTHSILGSWITTLAISLLTSMAMELIKKIVCYNRVMGFVKQKIISLIGTEPLAKMP